MEKKVHNTLHRQRPQNRRRGNLQARQQVAQTKVTVARTQIGAEAPGSNQDNKRINTEIAVTPTGGGGVPLCFPVADRQTVSGIAMSSFRSGRPSSKKKPPPMTGTTQCRRCRVVSCHDKSCHVVRSPLVPPYLRGEVARSASYHAPNEVSVTMAALYRITRNWTSTTVFCYSMSWHRGCPFSCFRVKG